LKWASCLRTHIPRDVFTGDSFTEELPPAARLLFDEKEHLLETHGKWDPSYTYIAAKNLEKYGIRKQEIAGILLECHRGETLINPPRRCFAALFLPDYSYV